MLSLKGLVHVCDAVCVCILQPEEALESSQQASKSAAATASDAIISEQASVDAPALPSPSGSCPSDVDSPPSTDVSEASAAGAACQGVEHQQDVGMHCEMPEAQQHHPLQQQSAQGAERTRRQWISVTKVGSNMCNIRTYNEAHPYPALPQVLQGNL